MNFVKYWILIYMFKAVWVCYFLVVTLIPNLPVGNNDAPSQGAVGNDIVTGLPVPRCLSLLLQLCYSPLVHLFFPPFSPIPEVLISVTVSCHSKISFCFFFICSLSSLIFSLFTDIVRIVYWNRLIMAALKFLSGRSKPAHWDNPKGWDGEGDGRGVRDRGHIYTRGWSYQWSTHGGNHHSIVKWLASN